MVTTCMYTKLLLRCFNIFHNDVTNVLTEMVPYCKSGCVYFRLLIGLLFASYTTVTRKQYALDIVATE